MKKRKLSRLKNNSTEETFETVVRDPTGRQLARWFVKKKDFPYAVRKLNDQFGLGIRILDARLSKDLGWLKD